MAADLSPEGSDGGRGAITTGIDLHTHTTASDGTLTAAELVTEAARRGLRVLAVTDHDSVEAIEPARIAAAAHPRLTIVPGIEINTDAAAGEIHVLGYFLDYTAGWLRERLAEFRAERAARIHRITERLAALGMPVDPAEVLALVDEGSAGRPHVARVMVQKGYVGSVREAFDRFLGHGRPGHVAHRKLTPPEAGRLIHEAGGLAVLAHPGFLSDADVVIRELAGSGALDGVECYYGDHTPEQTNRFVGLCQELGLLSTGGSDYHGPPVRSAVLGLPPVPVAAWEALLARAGRTPVDPPGGAARGPGRRGDHPEGSHDG